MTKTLTAGSMITGSSGYTGKANNSTTQVTVTWADGRYRYADGATLQTPLTLPKGCTTIQHIVNALTALTGLPDHRIEIYSTVIN